MHGEAGGGRTARRRCSDDGDQSGEEGDLRPPSTGWFHWDEEEDEAVRRDTSGELGAAQGGGDWRGKAAARRCTGSSKEES